MRRVIIFVGVALLALTAARPAFSSTITTLKPHLIGTDVGWAARADTAAVAYGAWKQGSGATLVDDGGGVQTVPTPAGCTARTAGSGHVFYDCGEEFDWSTEIDHRHGRVTGLDGAEQARLDYDVRSVGADGAAPSDADAIGAEWIHLWATCYHCAAWSLDYNWHTGEMRTVGRHDPALFEDLDAPSLTVPLCRPLRQNPSPPNEFTAWPVMLPIDVHRPWALVDTAVETADGLSEAWTLRRCGSAKPVSVPAGTRPFAPTANQPSVCQGRDLGDGWAALWRERPRDGSRLELLRLRDGRRFGLAGSWGTRPPRVILTAARAVVLGDAVSLGSLYTTRLPRH